MKNKYYVHINDAQVSHDKIRHASLAKIISPSEPSYITYKLTNRSKPRSKPMAK